MRRWLWNFFCAISFACLFALICLWVRSTRVADTLLEHSGVTGAAGDRPTIRFDEFRSERGTLTYSFGHSQWLQARPPRFEPRGLHRDSRPTGIVDAAAIRQTFTQGWVGASLFRVGYTLPRRPPAQYSVNRQGISLPDGILVGLLAIACSPQTPRPRGCISSPAQWFSVAGETNSAD